MGRRVVMLLAAVVRSCAQTAVDVTLDGSALLGRKLQAPGAPRGAKRAYREMQAVCLALNDEEVVAQIREAADAAVGIDGSAE